MNPAIINTTNVQQFGFTATFDLENSKLILDIANLTVFNAGGSSNIQGVNFSVIDPSGIPLSVIDFPNVDIDPNDINSGNTTYEVQLTNSASQYGWYTITGVLREADSHNYSIEVQKNICMPKGIKNGLVPGKFENMADCTIPKISVVETTNMAYQSLSPIQVIKNGQFYYPAGTLSNLSFTYTPFDVIGSGKVYTGDYLVRNKTTALYDLGENVFVSIAYASTLKFTVNCNSNICDVLCCVQKLQSVVEKDPTSIQGRDAKMKLQEVSLPLLMALSMEKCGKNAGDIIEDISEKLNCSCNCDGSESVEPKAIFTSFDPITLQQGCATTVTQQEGNVWLIKTKHVTVSNSDYSDQAFIIQSNTTDCAVNYKVTVNKKQLATDILNAISVDGALRNVFNSLIAESGIDLSGIDGKCIVSGNNCTYRLVEDASIAAKLMLNIFIDGITYAAPNGLGIRNAAGIQAWLNGLNKGAFTVVYNTSTLPYTTVISTSDASHNIGVLAMTLDDEFVLRQMPKVCITLEQLLQQIIDYVCNISDAQVRLNQSYTLCYIDNQGNTKQTVIAQTNLNGPNHVSDLISAFINVYCTSITNLKTLIKIDCATIKSNFVATDDLIPTDGVLGTRNGKCGVWNQRDMAVAFLTYMTQTNDPVLIQQFCDLRNKCVVAVCNPVTYSEGELIEPCPGISTISGSFTN